MLVKREQQEQCWAYRENQDRDETQEIQGARWIYMVRKGSQDRKGELRNHRNIQEMIGYTGNVGQTGAMMEPTASKRENHGQREETQEIQGELGLVGEPGEPVSPRTIPDLKISCMFLILL